MLGVEVGRGRVLPEWIDVNDHMNVAYYVLAFDDKRIHQFQRLYHGEKHYLAATAEWMNLHIDLNTRRVAPWPATILEDIRKVAEAQGDWAWPKDAGRRMHVPSPLFSVAQGDEA